MRIPSLLLAFAAAFQPLGAVEQSLNRSYRLPPSIHTSKSQPALNTWEGHYIFQEGRGSVNDAGTFVEHIIVIYRQGDELIADIDANGFQTSRSLRCSTVAKGDQLNLYFQNYREGNISTPYRKGQILITLERSGSNVKPQLLTYWRAYQPVLNSLRSGRVYFRKTN